MSPTANRPASPHAQDLVGLQSTNLKILEFRIQDGSLIARLRLSSIDLFEIYANPLHCCCGTVYIPFIFVALAMYGRTFDLLPPLCFPRRLPQNATEKREAPRIAVTPFPKTKYGAPGARRSRRRPRPGPRASDSFLGPEKYGKRASRTRTSLNTFKSDQHTRKYAKR